jgi:glycosyltransferase involved in cell wall biosynthesis
MFKDISIGIVIPSYNEGQDLIDTLKSIFNQSSPFTEVIVVDDSSDGTDQLVADIFGEKVKLIHRSSLLGRSSARNLGVKLSSSEVVVILNADVSLPPNFCEFLQKKYKDENCDALGVGLTITNTQHPYPRYRYAIYLTHVYRRKVWTEAFSVRRSTFFKTQGFPTGYPLAILAGEDTEFVFDLQRIGANICFDFEYKVTTVMPEDAETIESQLRGRGSLRTLHFVYDKSLGELVPRCILKQIRRLVVVATVLPFCYQIIRLWLHFNQGWKDLGNYTKYELYDKWLRSHQEWLDLANFLSLYRDKGYNLLDILLKRPSQLLKISQ